MERDINELPDLVELGTASGDTHGAGHLMPEATGLWTREAIANFGVNGGIDDAVWSASHSCLH